ncbi:rod shape-determining protein MreC [uncultured Eubacterium sp.]|uniref:rod shape-determining protein MreC n=1 Tax=uncultured Eubacterium sp. TaxID=165185 RepID=UPI002595699D|nr:rod shape-determining protein MreC [uncultured Eubacterium sp.]
MNWIREHKFISFLVLVIILAAGFLIFAVFTGGGSTGAGALGGTVFGKITEPVARLGQNISGVFSAGSLREKNEELSRRNRELQEENRKLRLREDDTQDLEALKKALRYKGGSDTERLISGDVTAMNDSRWIRTFTINLGKEDGVKTGSVVVNGDGLVGTVKSAGRGWAKVSTILDSSRGISFCLEDSRKTMGILHVSTDGELEGYMLDESAKVRAGDTLVTSGMGVYPERITVGKVKKVTNDEEEKLKRITVETAVQFDGLRKVAVLL